MGKGEEEYNFVADPTSDHVSGLWSKYPGCQRLIYIPGPYTGKRYLLGCDAVDCCWEEQDGNQVEFQIPNIYYADPSKKAEVTYKSANITTNFDETYEMADAWSWCLERNGECIESFTAYTTECESCVNGFQLLRWSTRVGKGPYVSIDFKNYQGLDPSSTEGQAFEDTFAVPKECQAENLLKCPGDD